MQTEVETRNPPSHHLTQEAQHYLMRLMTLGAIEGELADMQLAPDVRRVVDALHVVLAGGTVKIETLQPGNPEIVSELNKRVKQAMEEASEANAQAGYYYAGP